MILLMTLILLVSMVEGGTDILTVKAYNLSPKIRIQVPSPPSCEQHPTSSSAKAQIVTFSTYTLNSSMAIMNGNILWKEEIVAECISYFFGSKQMNIRSQKLIPLTLEEFNSIVPGVEEVGTTRDLTTEPMYSCYWPGTQVKTTQRIYSKTVSVNPSLHGGVMADGEVWTPMTLGLAYRSGGKFLKISSVMQNRCPLIKQFSDLGFLSKPTGHSSEISCPARSLQFTFSHTNPLYSCLDSQKQVYISDLGFLVEIVGTKTIDGSKASIVKALSGSNRLSDDLVDAEIQFDLKELAHSITINHQSISKYLCKYRLREWKTILQKKDANALAAYVTGDEFSIGTFEGSKFYIQTRISDPIFIPLKNFHLDPPNSIYFRINQSLHKYEPVSGLIDSPRLSDPLIPPILVLSNGSYLNLKSHLISEEEFSLQGIEPHLRPMRRDYTYYLEELGFQPQTPPLGKYESSNIFESTWNWITGEYKEVKIIMLIIAGSGSILLGYKLIQCCCSRSNVSRATGTLSMPF
ncbi:glycoprotein [Hymenopteran rhabdo-related virus]|uniref:Glycoprotein n=1 Tax=Hymenopteran rhabdo-related virus 46 TaxID=2847807 RepID=A0AAE9GZL4_9RHAB|nr:glycoprotein [Hymenopteran rhabdo-related virus]UOS86046.1 glycoprotein [Hymenopteran rhabdo-related virus 46]